MTLRRPLVLVLLACAACVADETRTRDSTRAPSAIAPPAVAVVDTLAARDASSRWVVTPRGYGPVLAGMSLQELSRVLGETVPSTSAAGSSCAHARPAALPTDVLVMLDDDRVARVDVRARGVLTAEGVGVGDTEASVLQRYDGRVRVSPHKYTGPTGHYLTVTAPPDTMHLIVFETDGRVVQNYRAGRRPAVELVEGCS